MKIETDRIGVELEVEDIEQRKIPTDRVWNVTHDASTERNAMHLYKKNREYLLKYSDTFSNQRNRRIDTVVVGGELVTRNPLFYSKHEPEFFEQSLDYILKRLVDAGESPFSYRGSVHVHVNFPIWEKTDKASLKLLQRILLVGAHLEEMFYHIGGMGYKYRGVMLNNSAFCRPITKKGPQVVNCETNGSMGRTQIFRLEDLRGATTCRQWYSRLGNVPLELGGVDRYHPARYTWLNLYSPLMRKTLEFRVFNKSLSLPLITSVIRLCQEVTASILFDNIKDLELKENSIYDSVDSSRSHLILDYFMKNLKEHYYLDSGNIDLLHRIIDNSELSGEEFGTDYVFTHLRRFNRDSGRYVYSTSQNYCPPLITERVLDSDFVDIHNMYGRR